MLHTNSCWAHDLCSSGTAHPHGCNQTRLTHVSTLAEQGSVSGPVVLSEILCRREQSQTTAPVHSSSPHELHNITAEVGQVPSNQIVWHCCRVSLQGEQALRDGIDASQACDVGCVLHLSKEPVGHQQNLHTGVHALPDSCCWSGKSLVGVSG